MSLHRYNAARDGNEPEIKAALKKAGMSVYPLDKPMDLLVGYGGFTVIAEVKMPRNKRGDPKTYSDVQLDFIAEWRGGHHLLVTVQDALDLAQKMKNISYLMGKFASDSLQYGGNSITVKPVNNEAAEFVKNSTASSKTTFEGGHNA